MTLLGALRDVSLDDCVAATPALASALCVLSLSLLLAAGFVVALFLPLAVLATASPTLSFPLPATQYPPVWLAVQAVWALLFGLGVLALPRAVRRTPVFDAEATPREPRYSRTRTERLAGLVEAVRPDDRT